MRFDGAMRSNQAAFTLAEMLVLLAALALLLAIVLPSLVNVRHHMQQTACAANLRQVTLAGLTFLGDHGNRLQPASAPHWAQAYDPNLRRWSYDRDGQLHDWASALLPYLGETTGETFQTTPAFPRPTFQCPQDDSLLESGAGHALVHTTAFGELKSPVSFGINYDLAGLLRDPDHPDAGGAFEYNAAGPDPAGIFVHGSGSTPRGPLETDLTAVNRPALTMLYAECGTSDRRPASAAASPLRRSNALYYTTYTGNTPAGGTLAHVQAHPSGIGDRIPVDRHRDAINVAFVDGRVDTINSADFYRVRVSPHDN